MAGGGFWVWDYQQICRCLGSHQYEGSLCSHIKGVAEGLRTKVISRCTASPWSISRPPSERSVLFCIRDFSQSMHYYGLHMTRSIPGIIGGTMALCVSWKHMISTSKVPIISDFAADIPSASRLRTELKSHDQGPRVHFATSVVGLVFYAV